MSKYPYTNSRSEAKSWGELDEWRDSHRSNIDCARAIETSIKQNFDGMHLDKDSAKVIIDEFGYARVKWVLANTLKENPSDGRFSAENRKWYSKQHIPNDEGNWLFTVRSHPAVLDGFMTQVHKMWDSIGLYDSSHCISEADGQINYEDKVLVFNAERMKDEHLHPEEQLFLADGGFGCQPNSRGTKIFGHFLWDDEECHITRQSVVGAIRDECLPDWAKAKLAEYREPEAVTENSNDTIGEVSQ